MSQGVVDLAILVVDLAILQQRISVTPLSEFS